MFRKTRTGQPERCKRTQVFDARQDVVLEVFVGRHFAFPRCNANVGLVDFQAGGLRRVRVTLYVHLTTEVKHKVIARSNIRSHTDKLSGCEAKFMGGNTL